MVSHPNTLLHCHLPYRNIITEKVDQVVQQSCNLLREFNIYTLTAHLYPSCTKMTSTLQHCSNITCWSNSTEILRRYCCKFCAVWIMEEVFFITAINNFDLCIGLIFIESHLCCINSAITTNVITYNRYFIYTTLLL